MNTLIYYIKEFGNLSLDLFWFPVLIWTICCTGAFLFLKSRKNLNPLFQYHLRTAAFLSLPFGIGISFMLSKIPAWFAASSFEPALFVVHSPIEIVRAASTQSPEIGLINWQEPSFFIGLISVSVALVSLFMLGRLISNYAALKSLYKELSLTELQKFNPGNAFLSRTSIKVAFHDHPLVPFTFGWKQPVIVLPEILRNEPEKLEMALQHELIHIKRGDYLLQLALSMIESLFWFHPLIKYGTQEIDAYREISCDQEVLSKSDFSIKSYASLLYELVPLSSGTSRLSVSMAVKNSTLKKRIKTMKYHKLHKASFKQSIAFLMLMVIGITLPIACSDLRGPQDLSEEELENTQITIREPSITINGIELDNEYLKDASTSGLGAFVIVAGKHGIFKIAPRSFDGAVQSGRIDGNSLSFEINELIVEVNSSTEILKENQSTSLWVAHATEIDGSSNQYPPLISAIENALSEMPPPPPALPSPPTTPKKDTEDDFFVVVERMPELIGGMKSIQSKVEYPQSARQAGVEGRVTIQFIVNENGDVEEPKVVRGIGSGADEEALRVIKEAKFKPGLQRGMPVKVQYAMSINFQLNDSDFTSAASSPPTPVDAEPINVDILKSENGELQGVVTTASGEPLAGTNIIVTGTNKGTATDTNGEFILKGIDVDNLQLSISHVGYKTKTLTVSL